MRALLLVFVLLAGCAAAPAPSPQAGVAPPAPFAKTPFQGTSDGVAPNADTCVNPTPYARGRAMVDVPQGAQSAVIEVRAGNATAQAPGGMPLHVVVGDAATRTDVGFTPTAKGDGEGHVRIVLGVGSLRGMSRLETDVYPCTQAVNVPWDGVASWFSQSPDAGYTAWPS